MNRLLYFLAILLHVVACGEERASPRGSSEVANLEELPGFCITSLQFPDPLFGNTSLALTMTTTTTGLLQCKTTEELSDALRVVGGVISFAGSVCVRTGIGGGFGGLMALGGAGLVLTGTILSSVPCEPSEALTPSTARAIENETCRALAEAGQSCGEPLAGVWNVTGAPLAPSASQPVVWNVQRVEITRHSDADVALKVGDGVAMFYIQPCTAAAGCQQVVAFPLFYVVSGRDLRLLQQNGNPASLELRGIITYGVDIQARKTTALSLDMTRTQGPGNPLTDALLRVRHLAR